MNSERVFEERRAAMTGLAYRMLGSRTEAEDVVQDAWLRWSSAEHVENPDGFLHRVVTRLCLDRLKSARARREVYVGEWLPEPVIEGDALSPASGEDLSFTFLLALERLTPLERAAFLLHDVFDTPFREIAATLGRSVAACRQLAARAREHVRAGKPRYHPSPEEQKRLTEAFLIAALTGDADGLRRVLAEGATVHGDGGGNAKANLKPVFGRENSIKLLLGVLRKFPPPMGSWARFTRINGDPGVVVVAPNNAAFQTTTLEVTEDGISAIYIVTNPDKLAHIMIEP